MLSVRETVSTVEFGVTVADFLDKLIPVTSGRNINLLLNLMVSFSD